MNVTLKLQFKWDFKMMIMLLFFGISPKNHTWRIDSMNVKGKFNVVWVLKENVFSLRRFG